MASVKIWDKEKRAVKVDDRGEEITREIDPGMVHSVTPFTLRKPTDELFDGTSVTLKDSNGKPGERILVGENPHTVGRRIGVPVQGASGVPDAPADPRMTEATRGLPRGDAERPGPVAPSNGNPVSTPAARQ